MEQRTEIGFCFGNSNQAQHFKVSVKLSTYYVCCSLDARSGFLLRQPLPLEVPSRQPGRGVRPPLTWLCLETGKASPLPH